jgi:uncharacterized protein
LQQYGHPVVAVGKKFSKTDTITIENEKKGFDHIDTITLYLNPELQRDYYDYILSLKPKRIIFNPGAENDELATLASEHSITTIEACTLVMLSTGQY